MLQKLENLSGDLQDSGEKLIQGNTAMSTSGLSQHRSRHTHEHGEHACMDTHTHTPLGRGTTVFIYVHAFNHSSISFSLDPVSFQVYILTTVKSGKAASI